MQLELLEKEKVERFKETLEVAKTKEKYGFGAGLDSRWAQVQLGLVQDDLMKTESDYSKIENEFRQILSLDNSDSNLILLDSLPYSVANASEVSQERFSVEKTPELLLAKDNVIKSKENESYAKRRWIPDFSITGAYNKTDGTSMTLNFDNNWDFSMTGALPVHSDIPIYFQNNYFAGFTCGYPIFDGHRIKETVKHAHSIYDVEQNNVVIVENSLTAQVISDKIEIENSVRRVDSLKDVTAIATDNVDAAHIKYRNGKMSLTQLLSFETDCTDSQKKYIEALYDLNVAVENLKRDLLIEGY